jgi:hypothetical protein
MEVDDEDNTVADIELGIRMPGRRTEQWSSSIWVKDEW